MHIERFSGRKAGIFKDGGTIMSTKVVLDQNRASGIKEKKTILIVDDVELFIQLQVSYLGKDKYFIHTANSGNEGLSLARALKPDLILLDLFMEDLNGDEVCHILKKDPATSTIPVVLVSSGDHEKSRSAMVSSGSDGLVFKPVRRDLLVTVVENLLGTDLRFHDRITVNISGMVIHNGKEHRVTIHSLSSDGAFLGLSYRVTRGDLMEISFTLPDTRDMIQIRSAAVVWIGTIGEGGPAGAGLSYLSIEEGMRKKISDFVRKGILKSAVFSENNTTPKNQCQ